MPMHPSPVLACLFRLTQPQVPSKAHAYTTRDAIKASDETLSVRMTQRQLSDLIMGLGTRVYRDDALIARGEMHDVFQGRRKALLKDLRDIEWDVA